MHPGYIWSSKKGKPSKKCFTTILNNPLTSQKKKKKKKKKKQRKLYYKIQLVPGADVFEALKADIQPR